MPRRDEPIKVVTLREPSEEAMLRATLTLFGRRPGEIERAVEEYRRGRAEEAARGEKDGGRAGVQSSDERAKP